MQEFVRPIDCAQKSRLLHKINTHYLTAIHAIDWDEELNLENINVSISNWKSLFLQIMDMSIPYKLSNAKPSLPWLSRKVARAIRKRNSLLSLAKLSQARADMRRYKNQRNRTLS